MLKVWHPITYPNIGHKTYTMFFIVIMKTKFDLL
jgi:hypothetical protein